MFDNSVPAPTAARAEDRPARSLLAAVAPRLGQEPATSAELALGCSVAHTTVAAARAARPAPTREAANPWPDWELAHADAAALAGLAPGPDLATALLALETVEADDAALLEAVAGWERIAAWVVARQTAAVNELRRRREAQGREAYLGDEIAARLGGTRAAGEVKVTDAWALEQLPGVWDALESGRADVRKARVLTEELLAVPDDVRQAVGERVLAQVERLSPSQIRNRIRRAALEADPESAQRCHERARADRRVELHPVRDGMAWLHAYLAADQAVAVHTALTAIGDAQGSDDPRPMDARRADALVDLATCWLDAGTTPDGAALPTRQRRRPHLSVTASATTLLGLDDAACDLAGYGPIPASMARRIAAGATWTPVLLDADSGRMLARGHRTYRPSAEQTHWITDRDATCTFPGCRVPATRCDIDHNTPFDPALPAEDQTVTDGMDPKCRHHHRMKTHGGWTTRRDAATGITHWTAPTGHVFAGVLDDPVLDTRLQERDREAPPGANGPPGDSSPPY